jgi:DNA-binding SARP family transcriptional activator
VAHESGLAVRLIGRFEVQRANQWLTRAEIGSRKTRVLLALLALERGNLVRPRLIVDALWPDREPLDPGHNVATMVSRIRQRFGGGLVVGGRAGYRLGDGVRVDLHDAIALVAKGEAGLVQRAPSLAFAPARCAVDVLSAGEILEDEPNMLLAEPARARQRDLLRRARHSLAQAALVIGDSATARAAAESAFTADPFDEAACRLLMWAHHARGEPVRALDAFHRLRAALAEELGMDPSAATSELHVAILRGEAFAYDHTV